MLSLNRRMLKSARGLARGYRAPAWLPAAVTDAARDLLKWSHTRYHDQMMRRAISGRGSNLADIEDFLRTNPIPLKAPLVLISQVQRSGGTLLSQLLDGHPEIAAYPHELRFGYTVADKWPHFDPSGCVRDNFRALFDLKFSKLMQRGYVKGEQAIKSHRFLIVPRIQSVVYRQLCESLPVVRLRDNLDAHFTAFFNSWLDYQGTLDRKTWISAFAPRLAVDQDQADLYFKTYPDGRLIQIIREPKSWYASARRHRKSLLVGDTVEDLMMLWVSSAEAMKRNTRQYGSRVIIVRFDDLVSKTEQTMRRLSELLALDYHPNMATPTFNGRPMRANSSFAVQKTGVIDGPLKRSESLSESERDQIAAHCDTLYEHVVSLAMQPAVLRPSLT